MSIQGISGGYASPAFVPGLRRPAGAEEARGQSTVRGPEGGATDAAALVQRSRDAVPADAPQGTDPALWSVLTAEERSFFARARAMGPLTYGPTQGRGGAAGALLGGRVDVKV